MAYDEAIADRVRPLLARRKGFTEKKMFGGVGYLLNGNMCCGVWKEFVILRLGVDTAEEALLEPNVLEFDITGKSMKGWVMVKPGRMDDNGLKEWVLKAVKFVKSMPAK